MKRLPALFIGLLLCINTPGQEVRSSVAISVDLKNEMGNLDSFWAWFGYDEPNYTYMKDGKKLLSELSALSPVPVHIRAHNLLNTGDGIAALKWGSTNVYTEDTKGDPIYDWTIIDRIFDTYVERGMKPLAQMGFMPEALSSNPVPYKHNWKPGDPYDDIYLGWRFPPINYEKWGELIYQWVRHSVERYGASEVESWYWELWNEPDAKYWGGTVEEYCMLYDYSSDAVKRALPASKVGGPHVTGPAGASAARFLNEFLKHCESGVNAATGKAGAPLDFIAFHAKGAPRFIDGVVRMNMGAELRQIDRGFSIVASNAKYKDLPVIIGECDPEGCAACGMTQYPQNGYRNGTMYSSYTASSFAKIYDLANDYRVNLLGVVSWSFEFEDQPWFHGFRDLSTNGVDKPVLNVFRMFGMMGPVRVEAKSSEGFNYKSVIDSGVRGNKTDVGALASKNKNYATVMFWNYHDDDRISADAPVQFTINGIPAKKVKITQYRIDRDNSNSYELWKKMGSPQDPTTEQYSRLEKAGMLKMYDIPVVQKVKKGVIKIKTSIQRQGVGMVKIEWD
ncbi:MAG: beta-xylosidase [Bacteroidia bacterium]|nr:beta-xylosidase [Bacteroidia bacterium]